MQLYVVDVAGSDGREAVDNLAALGAVVLLANKVDVVEDYDALYAGQVAGVADRCATSAPTKATRNSSLLSLHNGHLTLLLCQAE